MSETSESRASNGFTPWRFGLLLALLIFAAFPQVLLRLQTFVVRDYGFFSYPVAFFQQECFRHGQLPFWDPYNYCGVPFLAQWNTLPLYPLALIYLALPLTWSLSFFCLLHLWFAGFGMYQLARRWTGLRCAEVSSGFNRGGTWPESNRSPGVDATATQAGNVFAAAFAGVAFAFNGLTLNLLMWPSHIATLSWMPWVALLVERAWREGGRKIFLAALAGAMQMLAGGPETIFLTWIFLLLLWIQQLFFGGGGAAAPPADAQQRVPTPLWRFPAIVALVILLAAAQLLPFFDLAAHSQRETGFADTRWSMPAWGWVNFIVPMAFGTTQDMGVFFQYGQNWTSSYYLGLGTLWLALLAVWTLRDRRVWLFGGCAAVALFFAFGENTPIYPALQRLIPQLSLITYPVKYLTLVAFLAPLLAAFALARLQNLQNGERRKFAGRAIFLGSILLALLAGILFWAWRFPFPTDNVHATLLNGAVRAGFLLVIGALLLFLAQPVRPGLRRIAPLLLILVAWLDVLTHEPTQNPTAPATIYTPGLAREKLAMKPQPELGGSRAMLTPMAEWVFVHTAISRPQNNFLIGRLAFGANCSLLDVVPKVDGFFSLTPRENDAVLSLFYTRTNADFPGLEDFLGVSQISATDQIYHWQSRANFLPLITAGQKPVFLDDAETLNALTQRDFDGSKIVYLPPETKSLVIVTNQTGARVTNPHFENQTVDTDVEAAAPSLVVVAQTYYHDWRAEIDGWPAPLFRANVAFQAVEVPPGKHHLHLFYQDRAFEIGAAISVVAWLGCLVCLWRLTPKSAR
jgi:hypothetical protein